MGDVENIQEKCLLGNYSYYADIVRSSCKNTLDECSFNGKPFDCCKHFLTINTEIGKCYALNSDQSDKPKGYKQLNMYSNRHTGRNCWILSLNFNFV